MAETYPSRSQITQPSPGFCCYCGILILFLTIAVAIGLAFWLQFYIPPLIDPVRVEIPYILPLEGNLSINQRLSAIQKLFSGVIEGPVSFAIASGRVYTGSTNGTLVRIDATGAHVYGPLLSKCGKKILASV